MIICTYCNGTKKKPWEERKILNQVQEMTGTVGTAGTWIPGQARDDKKKSLREIFDFVAISKITSSFISFTSRDDGNGRGRHAPFHWAHDNGNQIPLSYRTSPFTKGASKENCHSCAGRNPFGKKKVQKRKILNQVQDDKGSGNLDPASSAG